MSQIKTYSELLHIKTFEERLKYLKLNSSVGIATFGFDRYLNQKFYHSAEWKRIRAQIIVRDNGCDLACPDHPIYSNILVHHMNPIDAYDISNISEYLINPEYLISVSHDTHNLIHYNANDNFIFTNNHERKPGDTCPWKTGKSI